MTFSYGFINQFFRTSLMLILWIGLAIWERAVGWPVMTIYLVTAMIVSPRQSVLAKTFILTGMALIISALYSWPGYVVLIVWGVGALLRAGWQWRVVPWIYAWIVAGWVFRSSSVPLDPITFLYLIVLLLITIIATGRFKKR